MKVENHNEGTSTIFFDNDEEINEYKENLKKQGFVKFDPEQMGVNNCLSKIKWNMKPFIVNDGIDYYVAETVNAETARRIQKSLQKNEPTNFNPIYRFTFLDNFKKK